MLRIFHNHINCTEVVIGERPFVKNPNLTLDNVNCVEVSGIDLLLMKSWGLPVTSNSVTLYFGDQAKFIISNWPDHKLRF